MGGAQCWALPGPPSIYSSKLTFLKLPHPHFSWGGPLARCSPCSFPASGPSGHPGSSQATGARTPPGPSWLTSTRSGPEPSPAPAPHRQQTRPGPGYARCSSHPDGSCPARGWGWAEGLSGLGPGERWACARLRGGWVTPVPAPGGCQPHSSVPQPPAGHHAETPGGHAQPGLGAVKALLHSRCRRPWSMLRCMLGVRRLMSGDQQPTQLASPLKMPRKR